MANKPLPRDYNLAKQKFKGWINSEKLALKNAELLIRVIEEENAHHQSARALRHRDSFWNFIRMESYRLSEQLESRTRILEDIIDPVHHLLAIGRLHSLGPSRELTLGFSPEILREATLFKLSRDG